ncbi:hypothetical protein HOU26_gp54 [Escherichia phage IMM-002]|uniref:Uncharacterized protein n=1 Tax=Escherichia phage IMM-002 TaxID=2041760 RepID=A0A384WIJ8_9CAUD|nr:hypothetical protein HOU26_gp54 [Escherichia phage IMM-002]ATI17013.1 hypothetical protein [Escherichia phage IMM-002]
MRRSQTVRLPRGVQQPCGGHRLSFGSGA